MGQAISSNSPDQNTNLAALDLDTPQVLAADGAITIKNGRVVITKGTAVAATLAAPVAGSVQSGGDDFKRLTIVSTTAAAHVITSPVDGFNAKGASGTCTFGAAKGNSVELQAYNGHWYTVAAIGNTVA
jgi:hypothetical protein